MACINSDGTLALSALTILEAVQTTGTAAEIATTTGLPLYRVRSSLRELAQAHLLCQDGERSALTEAGQTHLSARERPVILHDDQSP